MLSSTCREIPWQEAAPLVAAQFPAGLFLNTYAENKVPNTMTIGWGGFVRFFEKQLFMVPVRKSRYTYDLLQKNDAFTVSVPLEGMKAELAFAGTNSGRDLNKFQGHGLTAVPAQEVNVPIIKECGLHLECKVLFTSDLKKENVEKKMRARWYTPHENDMHTFFFGEILRCYYTN